MKPEIGDEYVVEFMKDDYAIYKITKILPDRGFYWVCIETTNGNYVLGVDYYLGYSKELLKRAVIHTRHLVGGRS